jgi:23S rRNA (uracil1939-C5)-methyltransferase
MRRLEDMAAGGGFAGLRARRGPWPFSPESGVTYFQEEDLNLIAFPGLFCQINFAVNRLLIRSVLAAAGPGQGRPALDLYAGSGNFSLPLAQAGWQVLALEGAAGSVQAGKYLAGLNRLSRALEFLHEDAGHALTRLAAQGLRFDLVMLDPPRAGAKGLMPALAALKPEEVIYVSCHPAALARDAAALGQAGYEPVSLEVFDMFPQTGQVEVMLILKKI